MLVQVIAKIAYILFDTWCILNTVTESCLLEKELGQNQLSKATLLNVNQEKEHSAQCASLVAMTQWNKLQNVRLVAKAMEISTRLSQCKYTHSTPITIYILHGAVAAIQHVTLFS